MDLRAKTCCFTGHRSLSSEEKLKAAVRLRRVIEEQIKAGVVFYGAGGALGFDTLAAQTVLEMKKEYPQLRLILVLPCENQTRGWRSEDIVAYEDIKRRRPTLSTVSKKESELLQPKSAEPASDILSSSKTVKPICLKMKGNGLWRQKTTPSDFANYN